MLTTIDELDALNITRDTVVSTDLTVVISTDAFGDDGIEWEVPFKGLFRAVREVHRPVPNGTVSTYFLTLYMEDTYEWDGSVGVGHHDGVGSVTFSGEVEAQVDLSVLMAVLS